MTETSDPIPLHYDATPRRRDSVFALIGLTLSLICAALPAWMLWQLLTGKRHAWPVYSPYAAGFTVVRANWPWYMLDTLALLCGVVGLQQGRPRLAILAIVISIVAVACVLTLVLGSPW